MKKSLRFRNVGILSCFIVFVSCVCMFFCSLSFSNVIAADYDGITTIRTYEIDNNGCDLDFTAPILTDLSGYDAISVQYASKKSNNFLMSVFMGDSLSNVVQFKKALHSTSSGGAGNDLPAVGDGLVFLAAGYSGYLSFNLSDNFVNNAYIDLSKTTVVNFHFYNDQPSGVVFGNIYGIKNGVATLIFNSSTTAYNWDGSTGAIIREILTQGPLDYVTHEIRDSYTGYFIDYSTIKGAHLNSIYTDDLSGSDVSTAVNCITDNDWSGYSDVYVRLENSSYSNVYINFTLITQVSSNMDFYYLDGYELVSNLGVSNTYNDISGAHQPMIPARFSGYIKLDLSNIYHVVGSADSLDKEHIFGIQVVFYLRYDNKMTIGNMFVCNDNVPSGAKQVFDVDTDLRAEKCYLSPDAHVNFRLSFINANQVITYSDPNISYGSLFYVVGSDVSSYNGVSLHIDNSNGGNVLLTQNIRGAQDILNNTYSLDGNSNAAFYYEDGRVKVGSAMVIPKGFKGEVIISFDCYKKNGVSFSNATAIWQRYEVSFYTGGNDDYDLPNLYVNGFSFINNAYDDKIELPTATGEGQFVGYSTGDTVYKAGDSVPIDTAAEYVPLFIETFSREAGASIRITANIANAGIRFKSYISAKEYALLHDDLSAEFGMLILPTASIAETEFIIDNFTPGVNVLKIVAEKTFEETILGTDYTCYTCAMTNLKEGNYTKYFSARGYFKITYSDASVRYFYTDVTESRSIEYVANALIEDTEEFEKLQEIQKAVVRKYAGIED